MRIIQKVAIAAVSALLMLGGSGYGLWVAWDRGLIGANPRAPVAAAMEAAARRQAIANAMTRGTADACIALELDRPQPEVMGFPGIAMKAAPGQYALTFLSQTGLRGQPARDIQLRQLDYLASQGFFTATDSSVTTDDGIRPARSYQMTWAGFSAIRQNDGNSLCLPCGRREFAGIEKIEKLPEKVVDLEVYEVSYVSRVADIPAWASTAEAIRVFPKLPQLIAETRGKVIRTKEGWRSAYEVMLETTQATGSATSINSLKRMANLERSVPTLSEAKDLVLSQTSDTNWVSRHGMACLPLHIQRGGDDRIKPRDNSTSFTVTYYDHGNRKEYEYRTMARALHVLSALEGAGLAQMEQLKPSPLPEGMENKDTSPYPTLYNAGIRYHVSREAVEALELSGGNGGCVPAGRLKVEVLAVHGNLGGVQIAARGFVEQTPEWAAKIGERLPALKSLLETGLPLSGQMVFTAGYGEDKWHLNLSPRYPEASYNTIPAHLISLMPLTAALSPAKAIKAPPLPLLRQLEFTPAERHGSAAMNAPYPDSSPPSAWSRPPYPAHEAPVHVVSVSRGAVVKGGQQGLRQPRFREPPEGVIDLIVNEPNAVVLLFARDPVEWRIKAANDVSLQQVIAVGLYKQRVTFEGGGNPPVVTSRDIRILELPGINSRSAFPTDRAINDLADIALISCTLTGTLPRSYQTMDDMAATGFTIGPQTPRFVLPARKIAPGLDAAAVASSGETMAADRLPKGGSKTCVDAWANHAIAEENIFYEGMMRATGGMHANAWSGRTHTAGKIYYEGRMRVTGSPTAHARVNIGLCPAHGDTIGARGHALVIKSGEQEQYKDGDLFGIAADFDQHWLYYHVNGVWVTGEPGSGNGIPLSKGGEYRVCRFAGGTKGNEVLDGDPRSDTTWEINLGESSFGMPMPPGYAPFQDK